MEVIREFYGAITFNVKNSKDVRENGKIELKYYKIISTESSSKNKNNKKYGIEVSKKHVYNNIITEEKKEIFNCIEKEEVVDRVLEMLKNNKVTPINVVDILEDLSVKKRMLLIK